MQIDQIQLLPRLFEKILIPSVVSDELRHPSAPEAVRNWMSSRHECLEVSVVYAGNDPSLRALDDGEKAAIALGLSVAADLILIDDRRGASAARDKGLEATGTLGILDLAARRGMVDLATRSRGSGLRISGGGKSFSMRCSSNISAVANPERPSSLRQPRSQHPPGTANREPRSWKVAFLGRSLGSSA